MEKQLIKNLQGFPPVLYHYTTISALYSIINGIKKVGDYNVFELYATHYQYANDPTEYRFFNDCLCKAVQKAETVEGEGVAVSEEYMRICSDLEPLIGRPAIVSFSDVKDDLAMWRMYGGNGLGVAIGVDPQILDNDQKTLKLSKCYYCKEDELIDLLIDSPFFRDSLKISKNYIPDIFILSMDLNDVRIRIKPSCYSLEHEWRLVKICPDSEYDYRERNGLIIPYIPFQLNVDCIKEICIGPCAEKELHAHAIKNFLGKKLGGDNLNCIKLEFSNNPYVIR